MNKRVLSWALTIVYVIVTILTFVSVCRFILDVTFAPTPGGSSDWPALKFVFAYIQGLIIAIIFWVCEYGIYSGLRYLLTVEKVNTGRTIWEVAKLVISVLIIIGCSIAILNAIHIYWKL